MSILETKELKLNTLERIEFYAIVGIQLINQFVLITKPVFVIDHVTNMMWHALENMSVKGKQRQKDGGPN